MMKYLRLFATWLAISIIASASNPITTNAQQSVREPVFEALAYGTKALMEMQAELLRILQKGDMKAFRKFATGEDMGTFCISGASTLPFTFASFHHQYEVVETLMKKGVTPNRRDLTDQTPLMAAAQSGDPGITTLLLGAGADPFATDSRYYTALDQSFKKKKLLSAEAILTHCKRTGMLSDYLAWERALSELRRARESQFDKKTLNDLPKAQRDAVEALRNTEKPWTDPVDIKKIQQMASAL